MGFSRFIQVNGKDYNESPFSKSLNWTKRAYLKHAQLRDKGNSLLRNSVGTVDLLPFQWGIGRHFCSKSIAETTQWGSTPSPPRPKILYRGYQFVAPVWFCCSVRIWSTLNNFWTTLVGVPWTTMSPSGWDQHT
jgi:hypothetical protein